MRTLPSSGRQWRTHRSSGGKNGGLKTASEGKKQIKSTAAVAYVKDKTQVRLCALQGNTNPQKYIRPAAEKCLGEEGKSEDGSGGKVHGTRESKHL